MANDVAQKDGNDVSTLIAVSSVDNRTIVKLQADPTTHRLLVQNATLTGVLPPASTPTAIGVFYIDTLAQKSYQAMGTSSSADWIALN